MSINERLNPPLWIAQNGITPLPTIYGWANSETGEMLYRVRNIPNPDLSYIFNAKQRKILESGGLRFVPTGAVESVDGEFQRFAYDGANTIDVEYEGSTYQYPAWYADLPLANRQSEYQISLKMPDLTGDKRADVFIVELDGESVIPDYFTGALGDNFNYISLELRQNEGSTGLSISIATDQENSTGFSLSNVQVGEVITIDFDGVSVTVGHAGTSQTVQVPTGFFSQPPNVVAYSAGETTNDIAALSVRVADLPS